MLGERHADVHVGMGLYRLNSICKLALSLVASAVLGAARSNGQN